MTAPQDTLDQQILALYTQGQTNNQIAKALGKPYPSIQYRVKRLGLKPHSMRESHAQLVEQRATATPPSPFPVQELALDHISDDVATQMRVELSTQTIAEYAEAMREGETFPPITVFQEGETYWPGDGWHRLQAARQIGHPTIRADVRPGGLDEAIDYACQANIRHGLRPTTADRRKAAMTQLKRHPERPDREIARLCGCSPTTVGSYRVDLNRLASVHTGQRETDNAHLSSVQTGQIDTKASEPPSVQTGQIPAPRAEAAREVLVTRGTTTYKQRLPPQRARSPEPMPVRPSLPRRSRAARWQEAVETLRTLQEEYRAWLENMPESVQASHTAELLEIICDLDLDELDVEHPRGFGRD